MSALHRYIRGIDGEIRLPVRCVHGDAKHVVSFGYRREDGSVCARVNTAGKPPRPRVATV